MSEILFKVLLRCEVAWMFAQNTRCVRDSMVGATFYDEYTVVDVGKFRHVFL